MKFMMPSLLFFLTLILNCSGDDMGNIPEVKTPDAVDNSATNQFKILGLGDSYTIGQSVCSSCRFPAQLKDSLVNRLDDTAINVDIIAVTGWTTTNLKEAIISQNPSNDYDLVTLLIGVNNQFQGRPFSVYETEFSQLLDTAIQKAMGNKERVIVLSIPDYAFTPFGQSTSDPNRISQEIDQYNAYARSTANAKGVTFVDITDITRQGLNDPGLVASDGLHPSTKAYTRFVERLLPLAINKIQIN